MRIKELRNKLGLTQAELGKKLGVSMGAVQKWETAIRVPSSTQRKKMAKLFKVSEAELFGELKSVKSELRLVPLISWVHADQFEDVDDFLEPGQADEYLHSKIGKEGDNCFALKVRNDCMEPEFTEGDIVVIQPSKSIESGEFGVFKIENKATLKQFKRVGNHIILHPLNPKYDDIVLKNKKALAVIGKVRERTKIY
jgi:SOS-response transcriptional repressor LexA